MARVAPFLALAAALATAVVAEALDLDVERYRDAARRGEVGTVVGRAYEERRAPGAPDEPLAGVAVILLPRDDGLWTRLETVKRHARDSFRRYRSAAAEILRARDDAEDRLWRLGAPDLAPRTASDADGRVRLDGVPAGPWTLVASRSVLVARSTPRTGASDRLHFLPQPRLTGYYAVTVWLHDLTVRAGSSETVELTDRTPWFTGIIEDKEEAMAKTTQLIVSLESKPGVLAKLSRTLADAGVNITGVCAGETAGRGKIRLLVSDAGAASAALKAAKYRVSEEPALTLTLENRAGALAQVAEKLAQAKINIKCAYATTAGGGNATVVLSVSNADKAQSVLGG